MRKIIIGMAIAALLLGALAVLQGGWERLFQGLSISAKTFLSVGPLIFFAFAASGLISVLISKEAVSRWLGREAGIKGLFLGAVAGALVPGGPYIFYPIAATFLVSGAEIGTVISFITAKNLWTLSRLPLEVALIGAEVTFIRYLVTFVFPILVGMAANFFFSGFTEKIRKSIEELQNSGGNR
jgi:uncharacterized protein